jgi:glycosyltransferase involved in cell wall biosynthesis
LGKYPLPKRKAAELLRLHGIEKMEKTLLGKARGIICAGESIEEFARPTGKTFLVRNCLDVSKYEDCDWSSTKVAVCGPFLKTYQNRYQLEYMSRVAKAFPKLTFLLIGRMDDQDLGQLSGFRNIRATGYVEDFINTLRSCSVLFVPYPHFTSQGGAKTKVLEAAACGMSIVATPYAICDFFAENVMVGKDLESLGRHLQYLSESEDNRKSIGRSMREYVSENHSHLTETKKLIKIYGEFSG